MLLLPSRQGACEQVSVGCSIGSRFPRRNREEVRPAHPRPDDDAFVLAMPDEYKSDDRSKHRAYLHSKENVKWNDEPPSWWGEARYVQMVDSLRKTAETAEVN